MPNTVTIYSADEVRNIITNYLINLHGSAGWQIDFDVEPLSLHPVIWQNGPKFVGIRVTKT